MSGGHEEENLKNFTEYITVVLSKVTPQPGAWGLGSINLARTQTLDPRGEDILPGHRLLALFAGMYQTNWPAWWPWLSPWLLYFVAWAKSKGFVLWRSSNQAKQLQKKCLYRDGQSWIEFLLVHMSAKVFITTKCLKFQHLFKKFKSWSIDIILLILKVLKLKKKRKG